MSQLSTELTETFAAETDEQTASEAADQIAAFADEYDESLTVGDVSDLFDRAPDDEFVHRFNWVVGELAATNDDCTDSRKYRLGGYDDLSADPEIGA